MYYICSLVDMAIYGTFDTIEECYAEMENYPEMYDLINSDTPLQIVSVDDFQKYADRFTDQ